MRIPPFYTRSSWQRFFVGFFIGGIISWVIFLYIYGQLQENQIQLIIKQQSEIEDLKEEIQIWREDYDKLNEENEHNLVVQKIKIEFTNANKLKLDSLTTHSLHEGVEEELKNVLKQDIATLSQTKALLIKTIENKVYTVDKTKYRLKTEQLYLTTTLEIHLSIEMVN